MRQFWHYFLSYWKCSFTCCHGSIFDIHMSNCMRLHWRKLLQTNLFIKCWWLSWGVIFHFMKTLSLMRHSMSHNNYSKKWKELNGKGQEFITAHWIFRDWLWVVDGYPEGDLTLTKKWNVHWYITIIFPFRMDKTCFSQPTVSKKNVV